MWLRYFGFFFMLGWSIGLFGQPVKQWSKLIGGASTDVASSIAVVNDSTLMAVGKTSSMDIPGYHGGDDFFVCNFSPEGVLRYRKAFGGPSFDQANTMLYIPTGHILVGGYSSAKGGDVSGFYGLTDMWLIALNPSQGMIQWEKTYGGTNNDQLNSIHYLEAGRIFLAGHTKSIDKDVASTPTKGGNDIFIASITEAGTLTKTVTFGGTKDETARKILNAEEFGGQMLVFGETESGDLDFSGLAKGKKDIFILKINRNLNKVSLKTYGGPGDEIFNDAIQLPDKTYMMFCTVNAKGGQIDTLKGGRDVWMVKLDVNGNVLASRVIGGSLDDVPVQAKLDKDGNIILVSSAISNDKDIMVTPYGGTSDVLLMKLDTSGTVLWQKYYGGTKGDNASAVVADNKGSIYTVASSFSTDFDLSPDNKNAPDLWVQKLFQCTPFYGNLQTSVCKGDTIFIHGKPYFEGNQNGKDTLIGRSFLGCDSIVTIEVLINQPAIGNLRPMVCYDSTLTILNMIFDKNHTQDSIVLKNASYLGCDSLVFVQISFNDSIYINDTLIIKDDGSGKGCIGVQMGGGCEPYKYQWNTGWTGSSNCNLKSGTYQLIVTDCMQCQRKFDFFLPSTVQTTVGDKSPLKQWTDGEDWWFAWENEEIFSVGIFDVQGRAVRSQTCLSSTCQVSTHSLPHGVYWGALKSTNGRIFRVMLVK